MKKQIALLATLIAASGFTALGQDWITFGTSNSKWIYDEFSAQAPVGIYAPNNDVTVELLWAPTSATDLLGNVAGSGGPAGNTSAYGLKGTTSSGPQGQVATNGVTSVASANPLTDIATMLASGWSLAQNINSGSGSAATGLVSVNNTAGGQWTYNGSVGSPLPFELNGGTGVSGSSIQLVVLAFAGSSYSTATALGWSNPLIDIVGNSASDPNATTVMNGLTLNQFGVAPVPEPTTLALAGLGGLSMLFLRRRKA